MFHEEMWMRPPKGRDMPQAYMLSLVQEIHDLYPHMRLVSLQTGRPIPDDAGLEKPQLSDWTTTADIIHSLDLVISVDTAVAHLAGAMGKPVWLLNRKSGDWRWHLNMDTSPWYPSMKIFTQREFADWQPVTQQVLAHLEALSHG
jgi:ADP-heptose:LPS heptosyltransferase